MKKSFAIAFAAAGVVLAGCAKTEIRTEVPERVSDAIGFNVGQSNITKAQALNKSGHYNFGVFAYKSTDKVNNVMDNYLVGYYDDYNAYSKAGTTWGDQPGTEDGSSYWMYENMGWGQFTGTYAGQRLNKGDKYASNIENQYLKFWDKSAASTYFYAYAPYVNSVSAPVTYVDGQAVGSSSDTYVMTIPDGTIKAGYDKMDEFEFMYASAKVDKANYGHDVALNFKRLNAKVNIKFWEDIQGYTVRIIDLVPTGTTTYGISAVPSIKDNTSGNYGYKLGLVYTSNGAKIQFNDGAATTVSQMTGATTSAPLNFVAPTAAKIGEGRLDATASPTTYFAVPKSGSGDLGSTGLTFHVSYELISDTGEVITVKDATVHVPVDYTNWVANTHYTYIFKITKNSNGTTDPDVTVKPTDPEVPTVQSLYPIVFDNCTVEDWKTVDVEYNVTDGTTLAYHDVQLFAEAALTTPLYSIVSGDIYVNVTDNDTWSGHTVDYTKITLAGPAGADMTKVTYASADKKITVAAGAAAGVYTVTYTCVPPTGVQANHPTTWTETFVVGNAYTVTTNLPAVGTHALAAAALRISATKDNVSVTPTAAQLSIEYPENLTSTEKDLVKVSTDGTKVEVAQNAMPGKYKLVYTITVDAAKVKVAEKVFDVVDYQPALTHAVVYLEGSPVVVKLGRTGGDEAMWVDDDCSGKITCGTSGSDMTITVANDTPEGVRTVYYVVNQSDADSKTMYQCTFNVQNTYTVALSKNTLNTTVGAAGSADYGTDFIAITSTKNGVADVMSAAIAAKYTVAGGSITAADYTVAYQAAAAAVLYADATEYNAAKGTSLDDTAFAALTDAEKTKTPAVTECIKLQVKKSVAAGNYKVVYTGQTTPDTKTAEAEFVIQK